MKQPSNYPSGVTGREPQIGDAEMDELFAPARARLESELAIANARAGRAETERDDARAALNLSRQRAEDAEADLAEAKAELAPETERADAAELELAEAERRIVELEDAAAVDGRRLTAAWKEAATLRAAKVAPPAAIDAPAVTAIAAELVARLAAHDAPAPRKRRTPKPKPAPRQAVPSFAYHV